MQLEGLDLHNAALDAAQQAVDALIEQHGQQHPAWNYCGFAWVAIRPARGKFVNALKKADLGYTGYKGGYQITPRVKIAGPQAQSMNLKEEAATAYAKVLRDNGIDAWMQSRAD